MKKRHQKIEVTPQSEALKEFRLGKNLSIQKLADKVGVSKTRAAQMENGRANVTDEYIEKFLTALEIGWPEWLSKTGEGSEYDELLLKCHNIIDGLGTDDLGKLYRFICDYVIV